MSDGAESTSQSVTHGIRVSVRARFVPERSNPGDSEWFFAYTIGIANESDRTVQLLVGKIARNIFLMAIRYQHTCFRHPAQRFD